ncbi:MAG: ABC transporter substrate-binding protein, partial [Rhodospirillales bacterium]|nr:ABC transporter substrate-binding protein [Rhodospirillales bacterium]
MKHLKFVGMLLGGVAAAGLAGAAHASPQGVSKDEIVFGINTALSGPASPWGVGSVEGIRMRFDEINEAGGIHGRKLKLIAEDHQYQVPKAVQAANKLINRDKIFAMVGALGTPMNNAVMPKLFEKNLPNLFPYTAARSMVEPQHPLKFLALSTYYDQNRIGTKYAVETLGKKAICRMTQDSDFGQETVDATDAQLKAMGMTLVAETKHRPDETDFVASIAKLRGAG